MNNFFPLNHSSIKNDFVIANFVDLENQLVQFMEYVPFVSENKSIISPKLIPIHIGACSLLESILKFNVQKKGRYDFKSYSKLLERELELENTCILFLINQIQILNPFEDWTKKAPTWWEIYNKMKHSRMENFTSVSLIDTVNSLSALHLLIGRTWAFTGSLMRAGWFNYSDEKFAELSTYHLVGCQPPLMPIESKLFVSPIKGSFILNIDPLEIDYWDFSDRVKTYIFQNEFGE